MLTSAKSHPVRATVIPARFCEVGVRMRMRSRFFEPLPRADSVALAAGLLSTLDACAPISGDPLTFTEISPGDLRRKLLDDVDRLEYLGSNLHAGVAVALAVENRLEIGQIAVCAAAEHAHVVVDVRGAAERPDHAQIDRLLVRNVADADRAVLHRGVREQRVHDLGVIGMMPSRTLTISRIVASSMSRTTPPTFTTDRMTRPPVVFSKKSRTRSRKRQQCMNMDSKPNASAARPSHKRCEWIRDSSCQMTRKYSARFGHLHAHKLLDGLGIAEGVSHGADAADALGNVDELVVVAGFHELLQTAVDEADLGDAVVDLSSSTTRSRCSGSGRTGC